MQNSQFLVLKYGNEHWHVRRLFQKSIEVELKVAWDRYIDANDRWKDIEAQKQAKVEIKVCV